MYRLILSFPTVKTLSRGQYLCFQEGREIWFFSFIEKIPVGLCVCMDEIYLPGLARDDKKR